MSGFKFMTAVAARGFGHFMRFPVTICTAAMLCLVPLRAAERDNPSFTSEQIDFYEKQVQPLLADNCYQCHSHQAEKIKGGFLLDSRPALIKGGESGPAIVSGDPEKSLLIRAVRRVDPDLQMPPKKSLTEEQVATLARWVSLGAPYSERAPVALGKSNGRGITPEDRKWWSFQPVRAVDAPKVKDARWTRNPIDNFILARLAANHLTPSPEAERHTLARRIYFDLIGLPPTAEEVERFVADKSPRAYEELVDALLDNPRYGEKWARHWLDLVRYAESDGYKADAFRSSAWRYRDYVIRGFNKDKPYNRFLMEQLAADELWPDDPDALIGVSFLRLWIYEYNQRNIKAHWATILNDITDVTGDALLGVGIQCARCHDHKFDPILQRDYYRLQAFFAALSPRDDVPLASPDQVKAHRELLAKWEMATANVRSQLEELERPAREKIIKAVIDKLPKDIQALMHKPASERTAYEQQLHDLAYRQVADEGDKLETKFKGAEKERRDALLRELGEYDSLKPADLAGAMLVTDIGPVAPPLTIPKDKTETHIEPGFLSVLDEAPAHIEPVAGSTNSTGRRTALAKWLTRGDNPLTARVLVNRVWQHHFGRGLVATPNDFGHLGEPPSHPELLDWLTKYFTEHNWSIKEVHRLILTSATYRQRAVVEDNSPLQTGQVTGDNLLSPTLSSKGGEREGPRRVGSNVSRAANSAAKIDPENRLLWRQNVRRLDSDQIRDAMLKVSAELDLASGGPSVDASKPRRTIYIKWMRNSRDALLGALDPPDPYTSTPQRNVTTTPMQSLVMINGPYVLQRARALASRLQKLPGNDPAEFVLGAYRMIYRRDPTASQREQGLAFLRDQAARIPQPEANPEVPAVQSSDPDTAALIDYCHVLLNSNEFLYID